MICHASIINIFLRLVIKNKIKRSTKTLAISLIAGFFLPLIFHSLTENKNKADSNTSTLKESQKEETIG